MPYDDTVSVNFVLWLILQGCALILKKATKVTTLLRRTTHFALVLVYSRSVELKMRSKSHCHSEYCDNSLFGDLKVPINQFSSPSPFNKTNSSWDHRNRLFLSKGVMQPAISQWWIDKLLHLEIIVLTHLGACVDIFCTLLLRPSINTKVTVTVNHPTSNYNLATYKRVQRAIITSKAFSLIWILWRHTTAVLMTAPHISFCGCGTAVLWNIRRSSVLEQQLLRFIQDKSFARKSQSGLKEGTKAFSRISIACS